VVVRVAGHLQLKEGAGISTDPLRGIGTNITGPFNSTGSNITIKTGSLQISGGGYIFASTNGTRKGGNIEIEAENIVLEGGTQEFRSGMFANAEEETEGCGEKCGDAGNITVKTGSLQLKEGAQISASTAGPGKGGNMAINADNLQLSDGSEIRARSFGPGTGGNINIEATDIELNRDAGILAGCSGTGLAGQIFIKALDNLRLVNGSQISVATTEADAGNITLEVGNLLRLSNDSSITTSAAGGTGNGGNITIGNLIAPTFVVLDGSQIVAEARAGHGGNIRITSDFFFKSPDSLVSAASGNPELSGTVVIDAPDTDILAGFAGLPANFLDAATVLTELCAGRSGANVSSLVFQKYEVLPDSPYALRVQLPRAMPAPRTAKQSRAPHTYYAGSPLPSMLSCLGNG
jgi:large exoprotein involved in heme utilization and adhesion